MGHLQSVRQTAREHAKENDAFAVCCSDGDFEYTRTRDEARMLREEMVSMRQSLHPETDYTYDIVDVHEN